MSKGKSGSGGSKIGRDAGTGRFIPVAQAQKRPGTTVVEALKRAAPKERGK